jgi:arylsulfatase A-like enzyme/Flp pilus assembly protein TadD
LKSSRAKETCRALVLAAALPALLAGAGCRGDVAPGERSVILVTLDTTRADRLGPYGGTAVPTPSLDRVARSGVTFEQAIAPVPLTLPAHSALMTGRYPASLGVRHNGIYRLGDDASTLAERLGEAGWDTAGVVAAYVLNSGFGTEQGFAHYDDVPVNRFAGGEDQLFSAERNADAVNAAVFDWLDGRDSDGKFFLWVHYYDPHDPYEPPEEGRTLHGEGYDREISYLDACFGDLLDRLEEAGQLDDAILVVAADHGESLGEHGERTHGLFLYEGAVRIPLLIRAPGLLPAGRRVAAPAELVDVAPTLLDLLGLEPFPDAEGTSLLPRIRGEEPEIEPLAFAETLMPRLEFGWSELYMVRGERFKYIQAPTPELYDLDEDPGELRNIVFEERDLAAEMAGVLADWRSGAEAAGVGQATERTLTPEEEERLRSLGYLSGDAHRTEDDPDTLRPDPKDMIGEVRALDDARDSLAAGEPEAALGAVQEILAANPANHQARTTGVLALIELGRLAEAERAAGEAKSAALEDPDASRELLAKAGGLLASVYQLAGKTAAAEEEYRAVLALEPDSQGARVDLARLLLGAGRRDEAGALVDEALRRDPRDGMALVVRLLLAEAEGDRETALRTAERLADQRAGDPPTLTRAGRLLMEDGQPARAAVCFELALDLSERLHPTLLGELGIARLGAGDLDGAGDAFEGAARLGPSDPRPPYFLGAIALRRGDEARARAQFDRALALDRRFSAPLVALGRWLAAQGRRDEAVEALQSALARNPADADARAELERLAP